jgi:hypothetical protein
MRLDNFTEQDIEIIINKLFSEDKQYASIEDLYQHLAQAMCENFCDSNGQSALVLSRVYHSFNFLLLPSALQEIAKKVWGSAMHEQSKFIALMGTYGDKSEWQDRIKSQNHRVILLSRNSLTKIPMVSRLLQEIGIDLGVLLGEKEQGIELSGISGTFGIFHVSPALGSPYIPAQDFVSQYGVQSVLGTGVMLPQGDIAVYIGFSRVVIENEVAANIASLMSLFWQRAFPLLETHGMFSS